jgi:aldehyde dehydrogenase (NAD+)
VRTVEPLLTIVKVEPTIFLNPADDAKIYREEIFGPVITIRTFKTEEEAVKLANDTSYGLSGKHLSQLTSIYTDRSLT